MKLKTNLAKNSGETMSEYKSQFEKIKKEFEKLNSTLKEIP